MRCGHVGHKLCLEQAAVASDCDIEEVQCMSCHPEDMKDELLETDKEESGGGIEEETKNKGSGSGEEEGAKAEGSSQEEEKVERSGDEEEAETVVDSPTQRGGFQHRRGRGRSADTGRGFVDTRCR